MGRSDLGNIYPWTWHLDIFKRKANAIKKEFLVARLCRATKNSFFIKSQNHKVTVNKMSTSERIEQLAAAIAEDIYIDIAKWHLYLNDAHLHRPLAEKFYPMMVAGIKAADVSQVLNDTKIAIGGGKREIALSDLIPSSCQSRLLNILEEFEY